jgi:hypothetical protein
MRFMVEIVLIGRRRFPPHEFADNSFRAILPAVAARNALYR